MKKFLLQFVLTWIISCAGYFLSEFLELGSLNYWLGFYVGIICMAVGAKIYKLI